VVFVRVLLRIVEVDLGGIEVGLVKFEAGLVKIEAGFVGIVAEWLRVVGRRRGDCFRLAWAFGVGPSWEWVGCRS